MKIGRNEPCPCGSGKKYKRCCLLRRNPGWQIFPEDYVIGDLIKNSKSFRAFYYKERPRLKEPIHWAQDILLPEGIDFRTTRLQTGEKMLLLRRVPASLNDIPHIAHEILHFILDIEGFPCTGGAGPFHQISAALNSMVHDPIVNARLRSYGFSLLDQYEKEKVESIRQLNKKPSCPTSRLDRILWSINYVADFLEWEVANKSIGKQNKFHDWFDKKYPDIAKDAKELLALVKKIGYDTPEKQNKLFSEVINRYMLEGKVIF